MAKPRTGGRHGIVLAFGAAACFAEPPPIEDGGTTTEADASTGPTAGSSMSISTSAEDVGEVSTIGSTTTSDVTSDSGLETSDATGVGDTTGPLAECGNGELEPGEDCDDHNTMPGDGCHSDCTQYKLVFVTSGVFTGAMGGLAGADSLCQGAADAAGLEGIFAAWVSDDTMAAGIRLAGSSLAYRLHDGTRIAADWPDVVDGAIENPIWIDEHGMGLDSGAFAWTGTNEFGAIAGPTCANWSPSATSGRVGAVDWAEPAQWTDADEYGCGQLLRLYCFEQ